MWHFMAVAALLATGAAAQENFPGIGDEILVYGPTTVVLPVHPVLLGPTEEKGFAEFTAGGAYFGAFVVDAGAGDYYTWVYGYQSAEAAAEAAYRQCAEDVGADRNCVIYARVQPQGYRPRLGRATVLGALAAGSFRDFLAHPTDPGKHTAFAISAVADGWGWNYPSAAAAEGGAMSACEESTARTLGNLGPAAQAAIRNGGYNTCRVIALRSPGGP